VYSTLYRFLDEGMLNPHSSPPILERVIVSKQLNQSGVVLDKHTQHLEYTAATASIQSTEWLYITLFNFLFKDASINKEVIKLFLFENNGYLYLQGE